jgi:peptide/nickel transport system substrate-binding protein
MIAEAGDKVCATWFWRQPKNLWLRKSVRWEELEMKKLATLTVALIAAGASVCWFTTEKASAQKRGGMLNFVVGSKIPSYDGHTETTFGMIHPIRPFYSLLIRVNPDNPSSPTDFTCDLCVGDVPEPTDDGKTYTFKIRTGVKFHDGTPLTAHDIDATFNKIIFPPEGIPSSRKAFFSMVESVKATDDETVVFKLKFASGSFMPSVAMPFNFVYSKKDLDEHGYRWHQKHINGTGPFVFVEHQPGAFVRGRRYENYHFKGRPYLDGFTAISAPKMALRLQAIRGDRAAAEFRGFPPKARDDLVRALGDKVTVQEGDWNCGLFLTPNHGVKPFDDPRVRRALSLALNRWEGSKHLSQIAIVKTVGGIVYPKHPLAATKDELLQLAGYGTDIAKSRAEAKRLLKEAGAEGLSFTLLNRGVDQPYQAVGTWAIDQWRKIGLKVKQLTVPSPVWYSKLRKTKDFDVSTDANCQSVVNPISDVAKFLGGQSNNYGNYKDPELDAIYAELVKAPSAAEQRKIMRRFETRALNDQTHMITTMWWYRITVHRSYFKGWKISPSHYLNQHLDNVWLDK